MEPVIRQRWLWLVGGGEEEGALKKKRMRAGAIAWIS
jgi:hypothetical protein